MKAHSIKLIPEKCLGCTHCLRVCPVQAIRIRNKKAHINENICIDCGECVRICPYNAHEIIIDDTSIINNYSYKILIVPDVFWSQFPDLEPEEIIPLINYLGFNAIISDSIGFKLFEQQIEIFLSKKLNDNRTYIIPNCPAVVRLIFTRFPSLIPDIIPIKNTYEITSYFAKYYFENILNKKNIGIFLLSTCSARVTSSKNPIGEKKSLIDGTFSIKSFYNRIKSINNKNLTLDENFVFLYTNFRKNSILRKFNTLNITGTEYIIDTLDKLESNQKFNLKIINPYSCILGCYNGILNVQNPYLARKLLRTKKFLYEPLEIDINNIPFNVYLSENINLIKEEKNNENILEKLKKINKIEEIYKILPHLDCGGCGSPNCHSFAEDIVNENIDINLCVFLNKGIPERK